MNCKASYTTKVIHSGETYPDCNSAKLMVKYLPTEAPVTCLKCQGTRKS